jgi:hypothetical protein
MLYTDTDTRRLLVAERHAELARDARRPSPTKATIAETTRRLPLPRLRNRLRPAASSSSLCRPSASAQ